MDVVGSPKGLASLLLRVIGALDGLLLLGAVHWLDPLFEGFVLLGLAVVGIRFQVLLLAFHDRLVLISKDRLPRDRSVFGLVAGPLVLHLGEASDPEAGLVRGLPLHRRGRRVHVRFGDHHHRLGPFIIVLVEDMVHYRIVVVFVFIVADSLLGALVEVDADLLEGRVQLLHLLEGLQVLP